jgi:hypothetical protein
MLYKTYQGASIDERTVMTLEDAKLDSVSTTSNTTASLSEASIHSPPQPAIATPSLWGSALLGAVTGTAVSVVAGSILFEGIQDLVDDDWA